MSGTEHFASNLLLLHQLLMGRGMLHHKLPDGKNALLFKQDCLHSFGEQVKIGFFQDSD